MPKLFKFTTLSLHDLILTFAPVILLVAGLSFLAYWIIDPFPPKVVTISTGQENSGYEQLAKRYAVVLARQGIEVRQKRSEGSIDNLQRLQDPESGIDIAFVQSGSTDMAHAEQHDLISLGSLFMEPVWLFYRDTRQLRQVRDLRGLKINVGPPGTGVPQLFEKILSANGMAPNDVHLSDLENTPSTVALLNGKIDGMVFSSAADALLIQMLLQTPGIKLFQFTQAEAYTRRFPFLSKVVLPRGIVDLGRNIPERDYRLIAPTATLVAREGLHPALVDLFVQAAAEIHGKAGWFQRHGEFPSASYTEIPVANSAEKYYRNGPPFLQRYMSFWLANFFERMWLVIVALGALILPLSRVVPPVYVWKVRSRIYRWYGQLRMVEHAMEDAPPEQRAAVYAQQLLRLSEIESRVNQLSIPLSFAEELYGLRSHIDFVRKRIDWLMQAPTGP
ncbi:MAG: TAXI family TRAP transporter solute-binding subunit [Burkholderiaceae bacterium]